MKSIWLLMLLLPFNAYRYSTNRQHLLGIKVKEVPYLEVLPDEKFVLTVFGKGLPAKVIREAWLTSADRCVDSTGLDKQKINLSLVASASTDNILRFQGPALPRSDEIYRICTNPDYLGDKLPDETMQLHIKVKHNMSLSMIAVLVVVYAILLGLNGFFSGMNLAFFCIPHNDIILLQRYNDEKQNKQAYAILQLRKHSNWLVCTLIFGNTIVNILSTLLVEYAFSSMDEHTKLIVVNVVPVSLNMMFGEIIPQALVNNRGLKVARNTLFFAKLFMALFSPIAYPMSRVLDWLIGSQGAEVLDTKTFEGMIKMQTASKLPKDILDRAFRFKDVKVGQIMTSINDAYLLSSEDILDLNCLVSIMEMGYTRVPVYAGSNRGLIFSLLNIKDLVFLDPAAMTKVVKMSKSLCMAQFVFEEMPASTLMAKMISGQVHMCIVARYQYGTYMVVGLITLEDIIEELIGEIYDDTDISAKRYKPGTHDDRATLKWLRDAGKESELSPVEQLIAMQRLCAQSLAFSMIHLTVLELRKLVSMCVIQKTSTEETILKKGNRVDSVYIVVKGQITEDGRKRYADMVVYGLPLLRAMMLTFCVHGFDADLSRIKFRSLSEVKVSKGSIFITMDLNAVSSLLQSIHNEQMHKEVISKQDYYVNDLLAKPRPLVEKRKLRKAPDKDIHSGLLTSVRINTFIQNISIDK